MRFRMKDNRNTLSNNRINFLIAIVFLFGILILYRLYDLQIAKYDLYMAKAEGQHRSHSVLEPERGEIFIEDITVDNENVLYPFATNKEFALIYAVPCDIADPKAAAEKIFNVFDRKKVKKEVDEYFKEMDEAELKYQLDQIADLPETERYKREVEIKNKLIELWQDPTWLEIREKNKEKEVDKRKEDYLDDYLRTLDKPKDPYEPLFRKVDEDKLKEFYAEFLSSPGDKISTSSLQLKDGKICQQEGGEPKPVAIQGISHIMKKYRYYPEKEIGSHVLGFVGLKDEQQRGSYGLEGFFENELFGKFGEIKSERGAKKDIVIVNDREYVRPENGSDLVLSINRSIQFAACQKLKASVDKYQADNGTVIVMDPKTGAVLSMCSYPSYDPNEYSQVEGIDIYNNPAIFEQYEPGSVFKTMTIAAAIDDGKISPSTIYNDTGSIIIDGWDKPIRNSDFESKGAHGWVDMNYVLEHSLNTGSIFAMEQVGAKKFADYVIDFGFGQKTGIELETESPGNIDSLLRNRIRPVEAATASFGQGITVTPLQMITAYAAIAND
ncbi:hypothetical protein GF382_00945, partial [Candidatus Falkowbacteria bacterium]|nr:hypothetical protein [Candidatus Falkowbacteria bacterium]